VTRRVLGWLEWVANPALAGAAVALLSLGVVTWLPALAAAAEALRQWRRDGEQRCFIGTISGFSAQWRRLWRHSLLSTAVFAVLAANVGFLAGHRAPAAFPLLCAQLGVLAALVPYHLALAVVGSPRAALVLAFGSPRRGLALLAAALVAPLLTLPLGLGPVLFGPTLPLLVALHLAEGGIRRARV
jgi:hypothetical protein